MNYLVRREETVTINVNQVKKEVFYMVHHKCTLCNSEYEVRPFKGGHICEECVEYIFKI